MRLAAALVWVPSLALGAPGGSVTLTPAESRQRVRAIEQAIRERRFQDAATALRSLVRQKPMTADGRRLLERAYDEIGERRDILPLLEAWCGAANPPASARVLRGVYWTAEAWRARGVGWAYTVSKEGQARFRAGLERAKADLGRAQLEDPSDPNPPARLVSVAMGLGLSTETMESWYRAAVKADALAYTAYAARHDYLLPKWRGAEGEAEEFALRCVRDAPQGSRIYTVRLANLVQQASAPDAKRFLARQSVQEEVAGLLRRWKADFPSSPEARLKEAAILRMEHDRRPVLGLMDEAIALDGEAPELWLQRGKDRFGARDYVGARADLERALSLGSEDASAYLYLGLTAHHGERDYARAIADYDRAIELDATEATTFPERGRAKAQLRRYAAAIADYDRAAAIDVRRGAIYYYRGTCRWQAGQREQAEADFALAARLEPKTRAWANAFRAGRSKE